MRQTLHLAALTLLAGCSGLSEDERCAAPNVVQAVFEEEAGDRITGSFCATCNGGLLAFDLQDTPAASFQISLPSTTGTFALPSGQSGLCPVLYWEPSDPISGETSAETDYTDGSCGVAAPQGVSGTLTVDSAPGSGSCSGSFSARLFRGRLDGREQWANVSFAFSVAEP